jgi:hypothetical protein
MKRQDAEYYGGLREKVLQRDGHACRVCGKAGRGKKSIMVHHRVPGKSVLSLMISLCLGCHSRVHKLAVIDDADAPELLRILWREQHPQGTEQYALDYSTALITHQTENGVSGDLSVHAPAQRSISLIPSLAECDLTGISIF